jgi:hypothetical protein
LYSGISTSKEATMKLRWSLFILAVLAAGTISAAERDEASIKRQIEQIKDSDTNAWRKIPWAGSLLDARRASAREKKPLFLFTHDGNIETGRC